MFQSNIPSNASATTRRQAARQSIIRLSFLENSSEAHLMTARRTPVKKIIVPLSMNERAFLQKIRETFPIMGEGGIEMCRVDRRRRILPVPLSSVCPASIKACPEFGRSAIYVRLKDTSRLTGVQHDNSNPGVQHDNSNPGVQHDNSNPGVQHDNSNENSLSGTAEVLSNPETCNREHQRRQMETLEQRRRQKIAERRMHLSGITEPEQGILLQFQYPDGSRKTRRFLESQPVQDLFAFAGSDNMASEVFSVQLAWSSNQILSTADGSLSNHDISSPSTLYVLWMSSVQIEGLTASSGESSDIQSTAAQNLANIQVPTQSSVECIGSSPSPPPVLPLPAVPSSPVLQPQQETSCSPSIPLCEDSEDEEIVEMLTSPVHSDFEDIVSMPDQSKD
nr:uncharacterized protein LOC129417784 [Misgurnus anguillicaudatus]